MTMALTIPITAHVTSIPKRNPVADISRPF
jgi:hypothetical protein